VADLPFPLGQSKRLPEEHDLGYSRRMRSLKTVSILLLFFFGLSFTLNSFASDFSCTESLEIQSSFSEEHRPSAQESTQTPCGDPCHYGHCHFGHCSFVFSERPLRLAAQDLSNLFYVMDQSMVESPFLEGLRRPPRV